MLDFVGRFAAGFGSLAAGLAVRVAASARDELKMVDPQESTEGPDGSSPESGAAAGASSAGHSAGDGAPASVSQRTTPGGSPFTASMLVLVVERDPHIRELEAHFLNEAGYTVEFATDGKAALEQAQHLLPDIVITEILVPKLDGLSLCRQLKADPRTRGISVLVFSILAAHSRATEAGADAFLMKPLGEHRLVGTVKALLDKQASAGREERT